MLKRFPIALLCVLAPAWAACEDFHVEEATIAGLHAAIKSGRTISTLNVRGERSLSCKAECDRHPSQGALPKSCPAACEEFRKQPDALERAAELDAQYGRNPDPRKMPMYCVAMSFKDVYDTRDMRTTGGADVSYAMDAPPRDATVVERLRRKGAIVHAKANLAEYKGGAGNRAGIQCRTINDTARVLDALRSPEHGNFFDSRDMYTALPAALVPKEPYASFTVSAQKTKSARKPLAGVRIGIVREYMVKHTANDAAISDRVNDEIKRVLRDELGAELVESVDPKYPDDPSIPNMDYPFQRALAEILPLHMPEYLLSAGPDGAPKFAVPGFDVRSLDYLVKAAEGEAPLSEELNLRSICRLASRSGTVRAVSRCCCAWRRSMRRRLSVASRRRTSARCRRAHTERRRAAHLLMLPG
ncbi:MAG: amidase family protein [Gammaproteobacteria bacterium]